MENFGPTRTEWSVDDVGFQFIAVRLFPNLYILPIQFARVETCVTEQKHGKKLNPRRKHIRKKEPGNRLSHYYHVKNCFATFPKLTIHGSLYYFVFWAIMRHIEMWLWIMNLISLSVDINSKGWFLPFSGRSVFFQTLDQGRIWYIF